MTQKLVALAQERARCRRRFRAGHRAQAASQIAVSAQQQLAGMGQLALATENIKQATSQNVDSTRQAETAAHQLHGLGQKLQALVGRYKL